VWILTIYQTKVKKAFFQKIMYIYKTFQSNENKFFMQFTFKNYKIIKTQKYIKKKELFFFVAGIICNWMALKHLKINSIIYKYYVFLLNSNYFLYLKQKIKDFYFLLFKNFKIII
jgi:hypothetical protein